MIMGLTLTGATATGAYLAQRMLQSGVIAVWSGAIVDIPSGWQLADGTNGTENLTDKFVVGAGSSYSPGDTGGATSHSHTWSDSHRHVHNNSGTSFDRGSSTDNRRLTAYRTLSGSLSTKSRVPPYYALAYIQKTGGFDYDETTLRAGSILMWAGATDDVPRGFILCDGTGGTPDLRNKFVIAAGSTYGVDATGGTSSPHTHSFTSSSHTHSIVASSGSGIRTGGDVSRTTDGATVSGTSASASHMPPYYALAFIQATADLTVRDLVSGIIAIWSGSIGSIPAGWVLCDGNNGTPNLLNQFVRGAGGSYSPGYAAGNTTHNHTISIESHTHSTGCSASTSYPYGPRRSLPNNDCNTNTTNPSGESVGSTNNMPPYHALAFIMLS